MFTGPLFLLDWLFGKNKVGPFFFGKETALGLTSAGNLRVWLAVCWFSPWTLLSIKTNKRGILGFHLLTLLFLNSFRTWAGKRYAMFAASLMFYNEYLLSSSPLAESFRVERFFFQWQKLTSPFLPTRWSFRPCPSLPVMRSLLSPEAAQGVCLEWTDLGFQAIPSLV